MPLVNVLINSTTAGVGGNSKVRRGNAPPPIFLDYLVVGGGGYGIRANNDGVTTAGGGGGVVSGSIRFLPRFTLDVTVGNGGTGSTATDGQASIINVSSPAGEFFVYAGGGTIATSGNPQFNPQGSNAGVYSKGGGGGSSSPGFDTTNNGAYGGVGGSGSIWNLDSGSSAYAGGGGGFGTFFIPGEARGGTGQGGGGNGASQAGSGTNGAPNTGGGAGGSQPGFASNGGSGIVKMRYISGSVMGATGGTTSVSGGYVYHTFTGSGQFVYQP